MTDELTEEELYETDNSASDDSNENVTFYAELSGRNGSTATEGPFGSEDEVAAFLKNHPSKSEFRVLRRSGSEVDVDLSDDEELDEEEQAEENAEQSDVDYSAFSKEDLVTEAEARGLAKSGNKEDLIARLQENDVEQQEADINSDNDEE